MLLRSQGCAPRAMVTGKLCPYDAAKQEIMPGVEYCSHKGLNNRDENSHLSVRRRQKRIMSFKSACQCQRFVSIQGQVSNLYHLSRKHIDAAKYRDLRAGANNVWREIAMPLAV